VGLWAGAETAALDPHIVLRKSIQILGSAYASPVHCFQAVKMAQRYHQEKSINEIITSRFGLDNAIEALMTIKSGKAGKVVLRCV